MVLYLRLIYFAFIYLIHGNNFKIGGPLLVNGGWCDWLNCCKSSCCGGSSTTDSDKSKSSKSSDGSGFELNIKSDEFKSDGEHFDVQQSFGGNLYLITFKPRVTCSLVKVEGKEVWQHGSSEAKYGNPKTVTYYKNDNRVSINFGANDIEYTKSGDKWEVKPVPKEQSTTNSTSGTTGTAGTDGSGGTDQSSGGTTGTGASGGGTATKPETQ